MRDKRCKRHEKDNVKISERTFTQKPFDKCCSAHPTASSALSSQNIVDCMADAVENAFAIVMGYSPEYQASENCRGCVTIVYTAVRDSAAPLSRLGY